MNAFSADSFPELGSENLRTVLYILQAYILLDPHPFLAAYGATINKALQVRAGQDITRQGWLAAELPDWRQIHYRTRKFYAVKGWQCNHICAKFTNVVIKSANIGPSCLPAACVLMVFISAIGNCGYKVPFLLWVSLLHWKIGI